MNIFEVKTSYEYIRELRKHLEHSFHEAGTGRTTEVSEMLQEALQQES